MRNWTLSAAPICNNNGEKKKKVFRKNMKQNLSSSSVIPQEKIKLLCLTLALRLMRKILNFFLQVGVLLSIVIYHSAYSYIFELLIENI